MIFIATTENNKDINARHILTIKSLHNSDIINKNPKPKYNKEHISKIIRQKFLIFISTPPITQTKQQKE